MSLYKTIQRRSVLIGACCIIIPSWAIGFIPEEYNTPIFLTQLFLGLIFLVQAAILRCSTCDRPIALNIMTNALDNGFVGVGKELSMFDLRCPNCRDL
ncbi:hypothetical protein [Sphingomonas ursincola]|jgi:hypothetical protein|uniref:hypothetical protein n=1 Tax=Sphingomonas ursincola TaxID=56361 RepID=UPI0023559FFB|nr:hypothetical protein [Sphingomonas ursincola]MBY0618964.1 hypothetical protein [Sphingomonas ursincola]